MPDTVGDNSSTVAELANSVTSVGMPVVVRHTT